MSQRKIVEHWRRARTIHTKFDEGSSFSSKRIKGKTIERIAKDMSKTRLSECTTSLATYRPIRQKTWRTNTRNNFVNACLLFSRSHVAHSHIFSPVLLLSHVCSLNARNVIFQPGTNPGLFYVRFTFGSKDNELGDYFSPVVEWFYDPSIYSKMGNNKRMTSRRIHRDSSLLLVESRPIAIDLITKYYFRVSNFNDYVIGGCSSRLHMASFNGGDRDRRDRE